MNQIANITERKPQLQTGGSIGSIVPRDLEEAFRLSSAIHQAGMSPYGIDTPQKIMIAMLAGLELGMPPMQGVQSIAVINNRPCMWGDALIGVVKNSGACLYVKEWIEGDGDSRVAYCETKRKGEDEPVRRSFSADDAKRAGLWQTDARVTKQGKNGPYTKDNDSPWYRYPQRMLQMRARAWCLRDVYPDVLKGMQSREEVEDYAHVEPAATQTALPPLEDRLRIARQSAARDTGEQEGFVTEQTPAKQEPSDPAPQSDAIDAPSVDPESGDPLSASPAHSADEADQPEAGDNPGTVSKEPAPASEAIQPGVHSLMVECIDNMLRDAMGEPAGDRPAKLAKTYNAFLGELPDHRRFVDLCRETITRIVGNTGARDQARDYLRGKIPPVAEVE